MSGLTIRVPSARDMKALGAALGRSLRGGQWLLLSGPLGAGKTTLAQGVGAGLGVAEPITSPTFTLVHQHRAGPGRPGLVHVDLYRLASEQEAKELGLADFLADDLVVLVEWPERAPASLPAAGLRVDIALVGEERLVTLSASGPAAKRLLATIAAAQQSRTGPGVAGA